MSKKTLSLSAALFLLLLGSSPVSADPLFRLVSTTALPGKAPRWDYLSLDAKRAYLFVGRRQAGVTIINLHNHKIVGHIDRSEGANSATLVPEFDRGYTTNGDGSTTVFQLSSFKTLDRIKLGDDADAGYYDPVTKIVAFMRGDSHAITFVEAKTGKIAGELNTTSDSLEASAPDGKG